MSIGRPAPPGNPLALIVVTVGRFAYQRPDGVCVIPVTALGP